MYFTSQAIFDRLTAGTNGLVEPGNTSDTTQ